MQWQAPPTSKISSGTALHTGTPAAAGQNRKRLFYSLPIIDSKKSAKVLFDSDCTETVKTNQAVVLQKLVYLNSGHIPCSFYQLSKQSVQAMWLRHACA